MIAGENSEEPCVRERGPGVGRRGVRSARKAGGAGNAVAEDWRGKVSELPGDALKVFWLEAAEYAQREIRHYASWRGRQEPVLADGYDAESVVQGAFERLIQREAGGAQIVYSAEEIRRELRSLIKHRVRWLHERSETRLVTGEWDVLPPRPDGEWVSVFDFLPGQIPSPDEELMRQEREKVLNAFPSGFKATLGRRADLLRLFKALWDGKKRREIARRLGVGAGRVKASRAQLRRRLRQFRTKLRCEAKEILDL